MSTVLDALPGVRLEVRLGAGRSAAYALDHVDFLIGAVPGCDLRVPGTDLPPVLCLIARAPGGARLRKLAPTQILLVNGQTVSSAELADGDRITLGAVDIFVHVEPTASSQATAPEESTSAAAAQEAPALHHAKQELHRQVQAFRAEVIAFEEERQKVAAAQQKHQDELAERKRRLDEQTAELQRERSSEAAPASDSSSALATAEILTKKLAEIEQERQQLAGHRQELADIRKQLYDRYQERRDRLAGLQEAVDKAAKKVQERKRALDAEAQALAQQRCDQAQRDAESEKRALEIAAEAQRLEQERRALAERQAEAERALAPKLAELDARAQKLAAEEADHAVKVKQYQADVLRLDRRQGDLERREQDVGLRCAALEQQLQQLQADSAELATQAEQLDAWRTKLTEEQETLERTKAEHETASAQVAQRTALLEGQQATMAALRTRLERLRDDVRREEQQLAEQRTRQEATEVELEREAQALLQRKTELDNEEKLRVQERHQLTERAATLDAAVQKLNQARAQLAAEEEQCRARAQEQQQRLGQLADQEGVLEGRLNQLAEAQQRLDAERQALRERTLAQTQAEQAREALQEQLRKRGEELSVRQKTVNEQIQDYQTKSASFEGLRAQLDEAHQAALAQVEAQRVELEQQAEALQRRQAELREAQAKQEAQQRQFQEAGRIIAEQQRALAEQQADNQRAWQEQQERDNQARAELEALRQDAKRLVLQLPETELRAGTALDRVTHAREQLRDHVTEIHAYVRQCQDDLEETRGKLLADVGALRDQEQALRRGQEEHRVALVDFRQQLIDWQAQVGDLKRQLARGETKLDRRQAALDEQVQELDAAAQRLAQQAGTLKDQHEAVVQQRDDLDRHLLDMRHWYRRKLRDLAGIPEADGLHGEGSDDVSAERAETSDGGEDAIVPTSRDILSITEPMDAGDLKLGGTLRELQLIDDETLTALLMEARRQRRSLRQVLLASGVVTLYQLALIEAGNVDGLMLGPLRVIDRLRGTAHEAVYRVFDPRRGQEAVLRHLADDAMHEAAHPEEFQARFTQAMIGDPHLGAIHEVLELHGRPAALQEWLTGLPASDWPPLAAAPGVCFRLLTQAALGLATAHKAGLVHGHLDDSAILLTGSGIVKLCGLGEPLWLVGKDAGATPTPQDDLRVLGRIASGWCLPSGVRKGAKTKPLPDSLHKILEGLGEGNYTSAVELLEDLDRAGGDVPANGEAWDRLLKYVREHETPEALLRQSA